MRPGRAVAGLSFVWSLLVLLQAPVLADERTDQAQDSGPPNVLLIIIDDLRPELGAYGHPQVQTPNIDRLAASGVRFDQAFANVPVCGASRASMLTGLYATPGRFVDYGARADEDAPGVTVLPALFRDNGYATVSLGKVFHHADDSVAAWTSPPWSPENERADYRGWRNYLLPENIEADIETERQPPPVEAADVDDDAYFDGQVAVRARQWLNRFARDGKPFFLAVGFVKPHLPFNAPKRYWDLYPEAGVRLTDNDRFPPTAPPQARHQWGELRHYAGIPSSPEAVPSGVARELVRGYYAATSYVDAQVGRVLESLAATGLADNTVVVLWGDHGWSLGEHALWAKHSPFELANRVPLLVSGPGVAAGASAGTMVESVDIYPTLVKLAGLPAPAHLQGRAFDAVLGDPGTTHKRAVFTRWKSSDSIRTVRYNLTEWHDADGRRLARMLFDRAADPGERVNVADDPAHAEALARLSEQLSVFRRP